MATPTNGMGVRTASRNAMTQVQSFIPTAFQPGGLVRTGSQIFFMQEKSDKPIYKRGIFWVFSVCAIVGSAYTCYLLYLYSNSWIGGSSSASYSLATAPPVSWGTYGPNLPCPYGGCTPSPVIPPTPPPPPPPG